MGLHRGCVYDIQVSFEPSGKAHVFINAIRWHCPYSSVDTFNDNWRKVE